MARQERIMSLPKKRAMVKQVAAQWCGGRATIVSWAKDERWPAKTKTKTKRDGGKEGRNLKEEQGGSGIINSAAVPKVHQRESCEGGW